MAGENLTKSQGFLVLRLQIINSVANQNSHTFCQGIFNVQHGFLIRPYFTPRDLQYAYPTARPCFVTYAVGES
jgi:hypothetical protein